jgi:hypothetical protein
MTKTNCPSSIENRNFLGNERHDGRNDRFSGPIIPRFDFGKLLHSSEKPSFDALTCTERRMRKTGWEVKTGYPADFLFFPLSAEAGLRIEFIAGKGVRPGNNRPDGF